MTKKGRPDPVARVSDPSFVPARADLPALLVALGGEDEEQIERVLGRAGEPAADAAIARFEGSKPPLRGRLVRVVARVAKSEAHVAWLVARLDDADAKTRRNAIVALGKHPAAEGALLDRWEREEKIEHRRSIAASLGKIGTSRALSLLDGVKTDDPELRRIVDEALLKIRRTSSRVVSANLPEAIDGSASIDTLVRFRCRSGIERILGDELGDRAVIAGPTAVDVRIRGALASAFRVRTALRFGFPLPVPEKGTTEERVAAAIAHPHTVKLLSSVTKGPIRYRIEWASAGHRRSATFKVAAEVSKRAPEMHNDPTKSAWEIVVEETPHRLWVEAWPKGLADPRFAYRVADVPGASHPTLAAALARVAGTRRDEVVWDPYAGGGTELVERARLGSVASLYGSDIDPRAVDAAKANLAVAGVKALVIVADARSSRPPEKLSLVITNPPMGRRVLDRASLEPLLEGLLANVAPALRRDGRLVWFCPLFDRIVPIAAKFKLRVDRRGAVDMGGFDAELQVLEPRR
ncbi:MAG: HEAT repeat domain-containing protein [Polyangiales bacterium]